MARFPEGQRVRALVDAQGLQRGAPYNVVAVHEQLTPVGNVVTYEVTDGTDRFVVTNGHLVLREEVARRKPLCPRCATVHHPDYAC
jgi:hypothetical protein